MVDRLRAHALLVAELAATRERIEALDRDFAVVVEAASGVATDDEHDPEGVTIAFERAQIRALLDQARSHLVDVEQAMQRLTDGSYGSCERCGRPIADERLEARPIARTCARCPSPARH